MTLYPTHERITIKYQDLISQYKTVTLTDAGAAGTDISQQVAVVERHAKVAVLAHGVVLTIITDPATGIARGQVHSHVEVAFVRVFVAVAHCRITKDTVNGDCALHRVPVACPPAITILQFPDLPPYHSATQLNCEVNQSSL